jgi:polyphenol oxidase
MLKKLQSNLLDTCGGFAHGFYTRCGGISQGLYSSLNCGLNSEDSPQDVRQNRAAVAADLGVSGDQLITLTQVHGANFRYADRNIVLPTDTGDGLVSSTPGVAIGVLTADCVPIILVDPIARVVGVAHAGWKGAARGIVGSVLNGMRERGARVADIVTCVGPAIQQESYQVGDDFLQAVTLASNFEVESFIATRGSDKYFDLPGFVERQCSNYGLKIIDRFTDDTYSDENQFFSYRRSCLRGEQDYGRQISAVCLLA